VHRPHIRKPQRFCPSKPESLRISNEVATLEVANAEFEASWKQWKAWAKLEEVPSPQVHPTDWPLVN
jgi:hypothetical protein